MTKPENTPWHDRSTWVGRTVLRLALLGLAYVITRAMWDLIMHLWHGVPFRTQTRLMSQSDWDAQFGFSDVVIYTLTLLPVGLIWLLAVGWALLALFYDTAHNMITAMKRTLTGRPKAP